MPVYEYVCDVCGMRFSHHRHYGDPHPTTCPAGHQPVHRVFAPPAIIFKGSGFYVTDNGRNGGASRKRKHTSETEPASQTEKTGEKT